MPRPPERSSTRLGLYVAATCVVAVGLAWLGRTPTDAGQVQRLLVLVCLGILAWNAREVNVRRGVSFSFLSIIVVASAALVGPTGAAIVGALAAAVDLRTIRLPARVFNVAMTAATAAAAGLAYVFTGGIVAPADLDGPMDVFVHVGLPLIVADVVSGLVNAVLVAGVLAVDRGVVFLTTVRDILLTTGAAYIGYGVIGFIFVVLWFPVGLGGFSAVLVLVPLLVARWAIIQYVDELKAHESTVETLLSALYVRDRAAAERGHRASEVARDLATELGLRPAQATDAGHAALLRDLGILAVHAHPGVTAESYLRGIDFLDGARAVLAQVDGTDLPRQWAGVAPPVVADVVTVATTWARLATHRATGSSPDASDPVTVWSDATTATVRLLAHRVDPAVIEAFAELAARGRLAPTTWVPR